MEKEISFKRATCAFMQEAGMELRLPQLSIATAIVFFHRFYSRRALKDYDRFLIGTTCLFLAGKVEETPKKLKDVILITYQIRNKQTLKPQSQEFLELKDQILLSERVVLQTIAFDLTVEHPYKFLLNYVKSIQGNRKLAQVAWNFVNDSLRTTLCLQYKPQLIASAAIYLASKFLNYQLPEGVGKKPWWEILDAKIEDLESVSNQILDLYESCPNVNAIKGEGTAVGGKLVPFQNMNAANGIEDSPDNSMYNAPPSPTHTRSRSPQSSHDHHRHQHSHHQSHSPRPSHFHSSHSHSSHPSHSQSHPPHPPPPHHAAPASNHPPPPVQPPPQRSHPAPPAAHPTPHARHADHPPPPDPHIPPPPNQPPPPVQPPPPPTNRPPLPSPSSSPRGSNPLDTTKSPGGGGPSGSPMDSRSRSPSDRSKSPRSKRPRSPSPDPTRSPRNTRGRYDSRSYSSRDSRSYRGSSSSSSRYESGHRSDRSSSSSSGRYRSNDRPTSSYSGHSRSYRHDDSRSHHDDSRRHHSSHGH